MTERLSMIRAADSRTDLFCSAAGAGSVEIRAAEVAAAGAPAKLPRLLMRVYTGGVIMQSILFASGRFYSGPVVADLAGMKLPAGPSPALVDHDSSKILGHGQAAIAAGVLSLEGLVSGTGPAAQEFLANSRNGFPYQASMKARILVAEDVEPGVEVMVNGQTFTGPLLIARETEFSEASAVLLGADQDTAARVAASQKGSAMDPKFVAWLQAKGHAVPSALSEAQLVVLKTTWEAEVKAAAVPAPVPVPVPAPAPVAPVADQAVIKAAADNAVKAERERVAAIRASAQGLDVAVESVDAAITAGESMEQANARFLAALRTRSGSVGAPAIGSSGEITARNIEAGMMLAFQRSTGMDDAALTRQYGEQTLHAAEAFRGLRLTEFMELCARAEGIRLPMGRGSNAWIRAAFSSVTLPGILGNVANKSLLAAYLAVKSVARQVCKIGRVSDFKTHTRYRLTGNMTFEKVAPGGELPHGEIGEQSFTQKADTYGKFFQLTRQDVVNDDLGAFLDIPVHIGRGSAISIEEIFFTLLLANTGSFFGSGNANIYANAAAGLGDAALAVMVGMMRDQVDPHGKPMLVEPRFMLVPTALMPLAERIFKGQNVEVIRQITATTTEMLIPNVNIHAGKYDPFTSPYLSNSGFHANYSAVDWYLFADPAVLAAFEIAFLNGVEAPVVEQVDVPPNVLGIGFRGYHDVGVAAQDPRGALKADVG